MILLINIILLYCAVVADSRIFPSNFSFGTGSSAYQTEGSWNEEGKSENIWDHWIHSDSSHIKNNDTADNACDAYKRQLMDTYYISRTFSQHYRFSISWSRILPTGYANEINMIAILHYQNKIEYLKEYDIVPVVTLYYHDLPQSLQDIGGWTNPKMAKYFADFARICFQYFPSVKYWITFNDPRTTCRKGYGEGTFAPGINSDGIGEYLCAYTVLKAHAAAYHVYKEEFKDLKGKVSISIDMMWSESVSSNDTAAVTRRNAFEFGLYANPIYQGNWPQEVINRVDYRSEKENLTESRLPKFTDEEISYINGTSDFMAISLFYAHMVQDNEEAEFDDPSYEKDMKVKMYLNPRWSLAVNKQPIVPESARKTLVWLRSNFNDPEIFITANGIPDSEDLRDNTRVTYFNDYLNAILDAIEEDGVKVIAYTAWSVFDSFEWTDGYRYGMDRICCKTFKNNCYEHPIAVVQGVLQDGDCTMNVCAAFCKAALCDAAIGLSEKIYYIVYKFGLYRIVFEDNKFYRIEKDSLVFYREVAKTFTLPEEPTTTTSILPDTTPSSASEIGFCFSLLLTVVLTCQILL